MRKLVYTSEYDLKNKKWTRSSFNISEEDFNNLNPKHFGYATFETEYKTIYSESLVSQEDADDIVIKYMENLRNLLYDR